MILLLLLPYDLNFCCLHGLLLLQLRLLLLLLSADTGCCLGAAVCAACVSQSLFAHTDPQRPAPPIRFP
jgi:hypothetical protein